MELVSLSAYAASHGASKQAAAKWKARGALVFSGKLVDVAASDDRMRGAGLGRFKVSRTGSTTATTEPTTDNRVVVDPVAAVLVDPVVAPGLGGFDDEALDRFAEDLLAGRFASLVDAARVKENALALKHLVAARQAAGAVVDLEIAEKVLFEASRSQRDAWSGWPSQIAPLLAADLDIEPDKVLEALTGYVQEHLEQLGDARADFLAKRED
jgi:hypothetical protein